MNRKKQKTDYSAYEDRAALCPHFAQCGGCSLQKISYEKQLQLKAGRVQDLIGVPKLEGILASPLSEGYRNKMEFTFGDECKDGPFSLGLHMRGSFMNIVNITDCHLIHPDLNRIRNTVRDFFEERYREGRITFRNNRTHQGYLRHLLLRRAAKTGEILAALVTTSQYPGICDKTGKPPEAPLEASLYAGEPGPGGETEAQMLQLLNERLLSLPLQGRLTGILHILNDGLSDMVRSDRTDILYGRDYIQEEILGLTFRISVFSFFQTNTPGAEVLYRKAREYAGDVHGRLFDLYSGTGTIAQLMSPAAHEVIGVEIVPEAVEAARENAKQNGISNVRFIAGDVLKVLDELPVPDYVILDPPREGIHPKALGKILGYGIPRIVYISCNPASLSRDLLSFRLAGYEAERACCVDMFPQTEHCEVLCRLVKRG